MKPGIAIPMTKFMPNFYVRQSLSLLRFVQSILSSSSPPTLALLSKFKLYFTFTLVIAYISTACSLLPDDPTPPSWEANYVVPVLEGELNPTNLVDLQGLNYTVDLTPDRLGLPYTTYPGIPTLDIPALGPFPYGEDERFSEVRFKYAYVTVEIENNLPFELGKGSILSVDNPDSTTILQAPLPSNLYPGERYAVTLPANTAYLQENLTLSFFNFRSFRHPGYGHTHAEIEGGDNLYPRRICIAGH